MAQTKRSPRAPGATYAISNTGPVIFAFQSDSVSLLTGIFAEIHIPETCATELVPHGWQEEIEAAGDQLVILMLTPKEAREARTLARQIAERTRCSQPAASHLGEAQAIVLALRREYRDDVLLLDELRRCQRITCPFLNRAVVRPDGVVPFGQDPMARQSDRGPLVRRDREFSRVDFPVQVGATA